MLEKGKLSYIEKVIEINDNEFWFNKNSFCLDSQLGYPNIYKYK
jgi:hypothetical protein